MASTWIAQPLHNITVSEIPGSAGQYLVEVRTVWRRSDGQDVVVTGSYAVEQTTFDGVEPLLTVKNNLIADWASLLV